MSDQDTPPPFDENPPSQDVPPPASDSPPPSPQEPAPSSIPASALPAGNVALGQGTLSVADEKTMGMLAHILGGVTNFLGPLLIWLIKKDESPFVNDQGKEALNFQITVGIGFVVSFILWIVTGGCASLLLTPALWIGSIIFGVLGGLEANKGIVYRYPFALRLIN